MATTGKLCGKSIQEFTKDGTAKTLLMKMSLLRLSDLLAAKMVLAESVKSKLEELRCMTHQIMTSGALPSLLLEESAKFLATAKSHTMNLSLHI